MDKDWILHDLQPFDSSSLDTLMQGYFWNIQLDSTSPRWLVHCIPARYYLWYRGSGLQNRCA
jgi:hypothetical protein